MRKTADFGAFACLAICLVMGRGSAYAQHANGERGLTFAAEVPLLDCDGVPCVEARTPDGKVWKMGIDTGNDGSVLVAKVAVAAGLKPTQPTPEGWPAGAFFTKLPALKVGDAELKEISFVALELSDDIGKGAMPHVDGTLAYTAFKDRILQLDFAAHQLRISDVLTGPVDCGKVCDKFSLITFGKQGPPIVVAKGFEIDGKGVTAQIDTMYTGSLLVYSASIEKRGLDEAAKTSETRQFALTDGGVTMKAASAKRESFRGIPLGGSKLKVYFPTARVHEPDGLFDATVGLELFANAIITLDFHNMNVFVQKGTSDDKNTGSRRDSLNQER
jgi:hypothetical protein